MPETLIIDAPAADVANLRYQESADGLTGWAQVGADITAAGLPDDPGGGKQVVVAAGDPLKYARLVPVSASGIERASDAPILPPRPADPATFTVYIYSVDAGLGVAAGMQFAATPGNRVAVAGDKTVATEFSADTDAAGYAAVTLPADAGTFALILGPKHRATIDTTGQAGQVVNAGPLFAAAA